MIQYELQIFFTAAVLEVLITLYKKRKLFALDDSINSISCGIISAIVKVFMKWISIIPYTYVYNNFSVSWFDPTSLWSCFLVFLAVDCGYYWMHREMHMINIGWAGHATHHSSEYLNLTTAARQSGFGHVVGWIFYLPLALFFPPELYAFHYSINIFYQIWIHTALVGKMHPIIETIFNTPSHHRVHHARNPEYLDKNFAGVLIIWDKLFGTFEEEKTEPVYGLVHPIRTWDLIWAQVHHLVYLYQEASKYKKWTNKVCLLFPSVPRKNVPILLFFTHN
jgi:alkylglycerol monooxygenase